MSKRWECLETLGLGSGATEAEIRQAYRDLVNVWHPDRFAHDPRLRTKAEEKLKAINTAFAFLEETGFGRRAVEVDSGPGEVQRLPESAAEPSRTAPSAGPGVRARPEAPRRGQPSACPWCDEPVPADRQEPWCDRSN